MNERRLLRSSLPFLPHLTACDMISDLIKNASNMHFRLPRPAVLHHAINSPVSRQPTSCETRLLLVSRDHYNIIVTVLCKPSYDYKIALATQVANNMVKVK
eukprot:873480-Pelagomonas_calceolata.AAC.3